MEGDIKRKEIDAVMIPQLHTLIAQYGSFGLMVKMIANKLYLFACFGSYGVIDNKSLFRIWSTIAEGYYPYGQKIYELSPVEPFMIQKSIVNVLLGIYVMHKKVCIPKTTHEFFQKRKQNEQIKYWSCPMSLLFSYIAPMKQRSYPQYLKYIIDLRIQIELPVF
jgi:hypothetical protein